MTLAMSARCRADAHQLETEPERDGDDRDVHARDRQDVRQSRRREPILQLARQVVPVGDQQSAHQRRVSSKRAIDRPTRRGPRPPQRTRRMDGADDGGLHENSSLRRTDLAANGDDASCFGISGLNGDARRWRRIQRVGREDTRPETRYPPRRRVSGRGRIPSRAHRASSRCDTSRRDDAELSPAPRMRRPLTCPRGQPVAAATATTSSPIRTRNESANPARRPAYVRRAHRRREGMMRRRFTRLAIKPPIHFMARDIVRNWGSDSHRARSNWSLTPPEVLDSRSHGHTATGPSLRRGFRYLACERRAGRPGGSRP